VLHDDRKKINAALEFQMVEPDRILRENGVLLFHAAVERFPMNIQHSVSRVFSGTRIRYVLLALMGFGLTFSVAYAEEIGTVTSVRAGAFAEREGKTRALKTGNKIDSADVLKTDATGSLSLKLKDGSVVSLGSNSELAADDIELNENETASKTPPPSAKAPAKPRWSRGAASEEGGTRMDKDKEQGSRKWPF